MVFKLVRTDSVEPCKILLEVGKHLIGRGKFLDCDDKRVSRNHGELEVTEDTVIILALHQNPCFVIRKGTDETQILKQNCTLNLKNGDCFGLLPNCYWYELLHCTASDELPTKSTSNTTEINEEVYSTETESIEGQNDKQSQEITFNLDETITKDNPESPSLIAPEQNDLATEISITTGVYNNEEREDEEQSLMKRIHSSEDNEVTSIVKKIKTEDEEAPKIKLEPPSTDDTSNPTAGPSNDQGAGSITNEKNNDVPAPVARADTPKRERCMYGANCYRRNPQHKVQFSHPNDADWGTGERAQCPWGAACRRRDPRHWRDHQHPPEARQPAGAANNPGNKRKRSPKKYRKSDDEEEDDENTPPILNVKRTRKTVNRQSGWDDSDSQSEEDPYATDDEDSEWQPLN